MDNKILVIGIDYNIQQVLDYILLDEVDILYWDDYESIAYFWENGTEMYETIIIAVNNMIISDEIYEMLVNVMGVNENKLIDFHKFYYATIPFMKVDKCMSIPDRYYDGMVLGISHAEVGIIPEILGENFVNLAVSSQDLYYNYKTLEHCVEKYPDKISRLNYLIIDMFDYTYFNYDVSKSATILSYYSYRGYNLDKHNFDENKNFSFSYEKGMMYVLNQEYQHVDMNKIDVWNRLFGDIHKRDGYKNYGVAECIKTRNSIVTDKDVENYKADTSIVTKRFEDTIQENIKIFDNLLKLAYKINPDMKIYCVLMPRYYKAQEKAQALYSPWKDEFNKIMNDFKEKYKFEYLDMKEDDISFHSEYYKDVSHLNYLGAIAYSKKLASVCFSS